MYIDATVAGTATIRTCHVIDTIANIVARISAAINDTIVRELGISMSKILKSEEA